MKRKIKSDKLKLINAKKDKAAADDISAHITSNHKVSEHTNKKKKYEWYVCYVFNDEWL